MLVVDPCALALDNALVNTGVVAVVCVEAPIVEETGSWEACIALLLKAGVAGSEAELLATIDPLLPTAWDVCGLPIEDEICTAVEELASKACDEDDRALETPADEAGRGFVPEVKAEVDPIGV